ncbi:MAG: FAD:protein FMN transferase [Candidatus Sabulitectum sp.]|nr:FAD:protein FMN transferase [Candidatus Sabulitectum sp.]
MNRVHTIEVSRTFPVLGTFATVIITVDQVDGQTLLFKADSLLAHLDTQLGRFSETGQLHHLNTTYGISTTTDLAELIRRSDTLVSTTDASFDPSLGTLSRVWGFPEPTEVPDSSAIYQALVHTGWDTRMHISADTITIDQNTVMDFGAIAKGYAVDRAYELLVELGADECLVEVGGEVRCGSSTGRIWHIGVRHPRNESLAGILGITAGAVATSGDYECFFMEEGIRYSHLLDSETGYPSRNSVSATVIAEDCATADAMATAAAVAGPRKAQNFPSEMYTGMIIITADENDNCETHEFGEIPWAE